MRLNLYEDFKVNHITKNDIIKCISNNGEIYAETIENLPDNDPTDPLKPLNIDDDTSEITVLRDGDEYIVNLRHVSKIEY